MTTTATRSRSWIGRLVPLLLALSLVLVGCTEGEADINIGIGDDDGQTSEVEAAGFLEGLLHGFISPFTGIASLFDDEVDVYDDNGESGYSIGFILGLVLIILMLLSALMGGRRYYAARRY